MTAYDTKRQRGIEAKIAEADRYRATLGFPPLVVNRTAKTITASRRGQTLADRPEISRHWNAARYGSRDLATVKASSTERIDWLCDVDPSHTWNTVVAQRCALLSGCPECAETAQAKVVEDPHQVLAELLARAPRRRNRIVLPDLPDGMGGLRPAYLAQKS